MSALKNNQPISNNSKGGARPGAGRKKGVPNKLSGDVKAMILQALDDVGGAQYLVDRAEDNPAAFMTLIGKVLPLALTGADGGAIVIKRAEDVSDDELAALALSKR